jgi:hypothetical protein
VGKQSLFIVRTVRDTDTVCGQSVPHRKHNTSPLRNTQIHCVGSPYLIGNITSPLQSPALLCCLRKHSLFIARTVRNTQIHCVGSPYLIGNITPPQQSPALICCLRKHSLFIVRTVRNTQIHCVGRMQRFSDVKADGSYTDRCVVSGQAVTR